MKSVLKGIPHTHSKVISKYVEGGKVTEAQRSDAFDSSQRKELDNAAKKFLQEDQNRDNSVSGAKDLPVMVTDRNGNYNPGATGAMSANNFIDAVNEKYNFPEATRNRAKANAKTKDSDRR